MNKLFGFLSILGFLCPTVLAVAQAPATKDATAATTPAAIPVINTRLSLKELYPVASGPTRRISKDGVRNFGKLNDYIWRSGQPTREGYELLAREGLKTVVNLRVEYPEDKDLLPPGVKYVHIPVIDERSPTVGQAQQFIEVVSNPENWPVLFHCHGGEGRAGTMAAIARHSLDGWDHGKIMKEVSTFRVRHLGFFKSSMCEVQQRFIREWEVKAPNVLAESRTAPVIREVSNTNK